MSTHHIRGTQYSSISRAPAVTGYSSGLRTKRLKALRRILIILVAATLNVIIDLDRPRRGFIQVSEAGMVQLKAELDQFGVNSEK